MSYIAEHICQVLKLNDYPQKMRDARKVSYHRGEKSDVDDIGGSISRNGGDGGGSSSATAAVATIRLGAGVVAGAAAQWW